MALSVIVAGRIRRSDACVEVQTTPVVASYRRDEGRPLPEVANEVRAETWLCSVMIVAVGHSRSNRLRLESETHEDFCPLVAEASGMAEGN